jgi:hypothetical protein
MDQGVVAVIDEDRATVQAVTRFLDSRGFSTPTPSVS